MANNWSTEVELIMAFKVLLCLSALAVVVYGGIVAAPLPYVAPYASSVAAHVTHHSVAAPYVAAPPVVAARLATPLVTAPIATPIASARISAPLLAPAPFVL